MSAVILSLDFECGWGSIDTGLWREREKAGIYTELRPALRRFVDHLDATGFSATWAIVGAMIEPPRLRDTAHLKGAYGKAVENFCKTAAEPTHDGRDLLDIVLSVGTTQHFGTHSYTHPRFIDPEQNPDVYAVELTRARTANARAGIAADRLVCPRNELGHLETIARAGISRLRTPPSLASAPATRGAGARFWHALTAPPAPVREIHHEGGLVLHSGTEFLNWGRTAGSFKRAITQRRINAALRCASTGQGDVHFWLHPFNLVETPGLLEYALSFLDRVARLRDAGRVSVATF